MSGMTSSVEMVCRMRGEPYSPPIHDEMDEM